MFLYIKTNILRGYGIFKNDFAHPREPATDAPIPDWGRCYRASVLADLLIC